MVGSWSLGLPSKEINYETVQNYILVTREDGFIGNHLVEALLARGCDVRRAG